MSLLSLIQIEHERLSGPHASQRGGGKALSNRPDLAGRVHLVQQRGTEVVHEALASYADYANVYQVYVWVHKAIAKIGEAIAPLPVRVVDADEQAKPHVVTDLLTNVNDTMNPVDLWQQWVVHHLLGGESFLELVEDSRKRPVEIWPRRPDQVGVRPDQAPERALYPRPAGYTFGDDNLIAPELMIHSKFYNPLNAWRGLAPIAAVRQGIIIDLFAQAWSKAFLKRGARPDYALIAPQGITSTEREELETTLMVKFSGSENWHRPIVLEQGITDIKTFSFAPKDIEWLEQRKISRDEVGGIFGVPDVLMGYGPETYDTETKILAAMRAFWTLTLMPLIGHRDTSLTHFFTKIRPTLKAGERVATDLSGVGVLQEDIAPKLEQAKSFFSLGYSPDAINERLALGMPSGLPGMNTGYLPVNLLPMGAPSPLKGLGPKEKEVKAEIVYGSARHEALWKAHAAQLVPHERVMVRQLKKDFQRQQNEVLRALRERRGEGETRGEGDAGRGRRGERERKQGEIPLNPGELLNWAVEVTFFEETYKRFFEETVGDFGQRQLDALGVDLAFDLRNPAVEAAIRQMTIKFAKDINETTQTQIGGVLREILAEADAAGWSIPEIQRQIHDRISQVFDVRKSDYETERIARTEMNEAANAGNLDGMRQSGVVERKAWLAALDDRTRETHVEAHQRYNEEPIALEAFFEVGGDRMQAPGLGGLPEENIFCRCSAVAVIE